MLARQFRSLTKFPVRQFSFDYTAVEEPVLKLEDDAVKNDNHLFTIVNRANTITDLLKFYSTERPSLALLHHSVFLNKITNTLKKADEHLEIDQKKAAEDVIAKVADHLFANISGLDSHSVL